jgi:MarR family transcriptional regulator, organic hydroperoxide resistance regulator
MQALVMGDGEQRKREVAEEVGMPFGHVRALFRAAGHDGSTMGDLALSMGCEASYVTGVIDNLEQHGLVTRQAHARDRRVKVVVPTAEGLALVKRAQDMMWDPPTAFGALSVEEQRQLRDLLAKLCGASAQP